MAIYFLAYIFRKRQQLMDRINGLHSQVVVLDLTVFFGLAIAIEVFKVVVIEKI
jgi:hypothetical protein